MHGSPTAARNKLARCTSHQVIGNQSRNPPVKLTHERQYISTQTLDYETQQYEWRSKT